MKRPVLIAPLLSLVLCACAGDTGSPERPTTWRDCPDCPALVALPGGSFTIGSPAAERDRHPPATVREGPQRRVAIAAFAIGRDPVTRREWAAFVADTGRPEAGGCAWSALPGSARNGANPAATWNHLGFVQTDDDPAVCIGWFDAQDYLDWLGRRTGRRYRLPSEAEWEYAARGGTTTAFPWGDDARRDRANYGADDCCSGQALAADRWVHTSPVGAFPPNAFGLRDLHGNAMQWVQDCLSDGYEDLPLDGSPYEAVVPLRLSGPFARLDGRSSCAYRMLRGGNWGDPPALIRSAARNFGPPPGSALETYRSAGGGFRVARALDR